MGMIPGATTQRKNYYCHQANTMWNNNNMKTYVIVLKAHTKMFKLHSESLFSMANMLYVEDSRKMQ